MAIKKIFTSLAPAWVGLLVAGGWGEGWQGAKVGGSAGGWLVGCGFSVGAGGSGVGLLN